MLNKTLGTPLFLSLALLGTAAEVGGGSLVNAVGRGRLMDSQSVASTFKMEALKNTLGDESRIKGRFEWGRVGENEKISLVMRAPNEMNLEGSTVSFAGEARYVRRWREEIRNGNKRKRIWRENAMTGNLVVFASDTKNAQTGVGEADQVQFTFTPSASGAEPISMQANVRDGDVRIRVRTGSP